MMDMAFSSGVLVLVCCFRMVIVSIRSCQPGFIFELVKQRFRIYSLWTLWLTALLGKARNARIKKPQEEKQDMHQGNHPITHFMLFFKFLPDMFTIFNSPQALLVHVFGTLTCTGAVLHSQTCIMDVLPSFQWHSGSFEE